MMKRSILMGIVAAMACISTVQASDGWEANVTVAAGAAENRLSFGQKADAVDCVDNKYDVPPMLGGNVTAYFLCDGHSLWRDIRSSANESKTWGLRIDTPLVDETIVLTWDPKLLPKEASVSLLDKKTDKTVDMKKSVRYTYVHDGPRELEITVSR